MQCQTCVSFTNINPPAIPYQLLTHYFQRQLQIKDKLIKNFVYKEIFLFILNNLQIAKQQMPTLFQKVGGHQNLTKIVAQFYQHILADDRINSFFLENVSDIVKLHTTMELFLSELFDGPKQYQGPDMISLHKNMKIKKQHFDNTWQHMEAAFLFYGIPTTLIPEIKEKVYSQFKFIVNTPG